jgi:ATP-dependent Clp protease ATP-binding subunit ClpA
VIQEHIKKPLADEVLFGKLKNGGHVRVIVAKPEGEGEGAAEGKRAKAEDKLGFEYLDGPVTPKPEKVPPVRAKAKRRSSGGGGPKRPKPPGSGGAPPPSRGSVPKIPLVKV